MLKPVANIPVVRENEGPARPKDREGWVTEPFA